ncbi:nuclear transport factor 2 family protein [Micromonospora costi]|uniref:Nuclear transport factor 2 family protein n=1 Tax=Micromonospora costi TaxID=1530042 RepID=A0A3B0ACT3_9ACTN|nr:nuclear transport factor 2 family protein [Micromonospora costi]RKN57507.1 nuclear transport factor 2 family protein [Micromonospora costi]
MATTPEIIRRYFALAGQPDKDAYFALFADDAVVEDEGRTYRGLEEIRAWRREAPLVSYEITDVEDTPEGTVVTATITGDFPGSPFAGLRFRFEEYDDDRIHRLRIAP